MGCRLGRFHIHRVLARVVHLGATKANYIVLVGEVSNICTESMSLGLAVCCGGGSTCALLNSYDMFVVLVELELEGRILDHLFNLLLALTCLFLLLGNGLGVRVLGL